MLTKNGTVKLTDFGLARLTSGTRITGTQTRLGTPAYMSPEQAEGLPADERSDIWSFGVVLYEMISGLLPFQGEIENAVIHAVLNREPEPLTALRTGVPIELDRVTSKALAKRREERYQHIEEMLVDLRRLRKQLTPEGKKAAAAQPVVVQLRLPSRRKLAAVLAGICAIGLLAAGWFAMQDRRPERVGLLRQRQITANPTEDPVLGVALSPDGKYMAYGDLTGVHVRLIATGETRTLPLPPNFCFR